MRLCTRDCRGCLALSVGFLLGVFAVSQGLVCLFMSANAGISCAQNLTGLVGFFKAA